ncbi:MAG: OmpA family protein [Deltaproteobacteria bacterium]|nr:OmpA family protein [Deltaproteobacteria bacterium]
MQLLTRLVAVAVVLATGVATAEPTSGIDGALFRSSYDANGVFSLEGARLLPKHDLSLKFLVGFGTSPVAVAVPGIGDTAKDRVLDRLLVLDIAFGMTVASRFAIGFDVAAYRTATGEGYGTRGRYGAGSQITPSTGLIALRRISNIDPSAPPDDAGSYLGDGLAGPLDARLGGKLALIARPKLAVALVGSVFLPFGEDEMLLGDRSLVFEPKLAVEWKPNPARATRVLANGGARIRRRTVLEGFDAMAGATDLDAKVFLDVGSEAVIGAGAIVEITPRAHLGIEAQLFVPLPDAASYGSCRTYLGNRCSSLDDADYFAGAGRGDLSVLATVGAQLRMSADVTLLAMIGTAQLGSRGDDMRVTTGLSWAPQPVGTAVPGRNDRDGDGVPDSLDGCRSEPEDKDGFQDEDGCVDADNDRDGLDDGSDACRDEAEDKDGFEDADGCPERDNDQDGLLDAVDRCPDQREDLDNFEDEDGCPDEDNDGDGIADGKDKCPLDAEIKNGFEDDDGCPDGRQAGPQVDERADRIDLKGATLAFTGAANLPAASKALLDQIATLIKTKKLVIRVEVHVPLGTRATAAGAIAAQRPRDKALSQQRARAVADYLIAQGVAVQQLQAVGLGSDRPLASFAATDAANARVDFIKAQQRGTP